MQLTDEQKEQLKMAHRASMRIQETWSLYTMFLEQDNRPAEALGRAQEAVGVWVEWMEHNEVEPPDIEHQDIGEQMSAAMQKVAEIYNGATTAPIPFYLPQVPVDSEFVPAAAEVDSHAAQSPEPASETSTLNTKEPHL